MTVEWRDYFRVADKSPATEGRGCANRGRDRDLFRQWFSDRLLPQPKGEEPQKPNPVSYNRQSET